MHLAITARSIGEGRPFWLGSNREGHYADKGRREETQGEDGLRGRYNDGNTKYILHTIDRRG